MIHFHAAVECMVDSMLTDYKRAKKANEEMSNELKNCNEVVRANADVIEALENEIEKLKERLNSNVSGIPEVEQPQPVAVKKDETIECSRNDFCDMEFANASEELRNNIKNLEEIRERINKLFMEKETELQAKQEELDSCASKLNCQGESCDSNSMSRLKELEERDKIISEQLAIHEDQIALLMDERYKLMEINNDLIKSISICQLALCSYDFDKSAC